MEFNGAINGTNALELKVGVFIFGASAPLLKTFSSAFSSVLCLSRISYHSLFITLHYDLLNVMIQILKLHSIQLSRLWKLKGKKLISSCESRQKKIVNKKICEQKI